MRTPRGVEPVTAKEVLKNPIIFDQVVDAKTGILPVTQQKIYSKKDVPPRKVSGHEDADVAVSIRLHPDDAKYVLIELEGKGTGKYVKVPRRMLKPWFR